MKKRRAKEREIRVREIQYAAKEVFIRRRFQNASMDEIARKAGVSKGTLYLYFKDKGDLYISLMVPVTRELGRMLKEFAEEIERGRVRSGREVIMGLWEVHSRLYRYDADGIRIVQAYLQGDLFGGLPRKTRQTLDRVGKEDYDITRSIVAKAMEKGLLRKVNVLQLADLIWAMFIGIVQVEESKLRATRKNHLEGTLEFAFSILADALQPKIGRASPRAGRKT